MGYHVTILRSKDAAYVPITLEEVQKAVQLLEGWEYIEQNHTFIKESSNGDTCTLWYDNGELWTKAPSHWDLQQMIDLASKLDARVRGDEFETYKTADEWYKHPDDILFEKQAKNAVKTSLAKEIQTQRWIQIAFIGFFVLLGAIGYLLGKLFES